MRRRVRILFLLLSIILFVVVFMIALMVGRYNMGFIPCMKAIFTTSDSVEIERNIIYNLRLPRTIIACLTGIALSLSGLLFQETFQNKLVSPDLLGVSSGAGVGAAFAIVLELSAASISLFAFFVGIGAVIMTMFISRVFRNRTSVMLLLAGIIVGGFMNSLLSVLKYCANPDTTLSSITYWLMGSFADTTMDDVYILMPVVVISVLILLAISWRINVVALGKEEAQMKGINYNFYRGLIIIIATLLTATTVAICGTISWVGLVIPHIVRIFTGKNTTRSIPLTITFGGIFMMLVDIFSRTFTPDEIPLSAITGLFGTVIFVSILVINRRKFYER